MPTGMAALHFENNMLIKQYFLVFGIRVHVHVYRNARITIYTRIIWNMTKYTCKCKYDNKFILIRMLLRTEPNTFAYLLEIIIDDVFDDGLIRMNMR